MACRQPGVRRRTRLEFQRAVLAAPPALVGFAALLYFKLAGKASARLSPLVELPMEWSGMGSPPESSPRIEGGADSDHGALWSKPEEICAAGREGEALGAQDGTERLRVSCD